MQSIVDDPVGGLRPGRLSDMNHFSVVTLQGGGDADVAGQDFPNGCPLIGDSPSLELDANGMADMIGQNRDEQMTVASMFPLMIDRAQTQLGLHAPESRFNVREHGEDVKHLLLFEIQPV